jgi:hypothetical protein
MHGVPYYPKILAIGQAPIAEIFKSEVEVTEKIDGSSFAFGVSADGEVVCRSKGRQIDFVSDHDLFARAMQYVDENKELILSVLEPDTYVYGEYLSKPKHNTLTYNRIPTNHIMVFGCLTGGVFVSNYNELSRLSALLKLETVPLLYHGKVNHVAQLQELLEHESVLGGPKIEGFVVKNYSPEVQWWLGGQVVPAFGKFVSEGFKEKHIKAWKESGNSLTGQLDTLVNAFRTEARWRKAIQHLRDNGALQIAPQDIGPLLKEIEHDLIEEEADFIKNKLYKMYIDTIVRATKRGFPEWYKEQLLLGTVSIDIGEILEVTNDGNTETV